VTATRAAPRRVRRAEPSAAADSVPPPLALPPDIARWTGLQRTWWGAGAIAGLVATLGFQTFSPSRRLADVEAVNARQDSTFVAETARQREALDTIRRQLGLLLAGQCAKERDRLARLLYECR
jgi:hypothetical protein